MPLLASPSSNRDQETAPRDPKAKCKRALSSSPPRSRGALGWGSALLQPGLCVPGEAAPPGGKKSLSHSAPGKWMPHASFPGGRGTFQAVFSCWRAGRGGASYRLLQIIDLSWQLILPPTHGHGAQCCCCCCWRGQGRTCCVCSPQARMGCCPWQCPCPWGGWAWAVSAGCGQCCGL